MCDFVIFIFVRATSPAVRQIGASLMEDHDRLNISIFALSGVRGVNLPLTMTASESSGLTTLTGKQDIQNAQKELAATADPEIQPLVRAYLGPEYGYLTAAQSISDMMAK